MRKIIAVLLLIAALLLCACDESEPLAPGESALSDVELDESEIIEGGWPADLLPEGFPEAPYTEIYSVERKDNEVIIVMFGERDFTGPNGNARTQFCKILRNNNYIYYCEGDELYYSLLNKQGVIVRFSTDTVDPTSYLQALNSPTGYAYEIRVSKMAVSDGMAYLFWEYPSKDIDLGLEEITFNEWPVEYLPEEFPNPEKEPNTKIKNYKDGAKENKGIYNY